MWDLVGALASGIGSYFASQDQSDAANKAAAAQQAANAQQQAFQQQQFGQALGFQQNQLSQGNALANQAQGAFAPLQAAGQQGIGGLGQFAQGGLGAFQTQQALSGALGPQAQQQAMSGVQNSSLFTGLAQQGEDAILQNASATGGLRGGNTQGALAQFRPQLLNQLLQQQFTNLGGLSQLGASSYGQLGQLGQAGAQGSLGILGQQLGLQSDVSRNVAGLYGQNTAAGSSLLGQQGAITANNALAQGQANAGFWSGLGNTGNLYAQQQYQRGLGATAQNPYYSGQGQLGLPGLGYGEGASLINGGGF